MSRLTVMFLCLMLCLVGTTMPSDTEVSAAGVVANRVIVMTIGSKILKVDDVDGELEAIPQIKWGRTFSPIAPIIKALGGTVEWDARTGKVTTVLGSRTIALTISSRYAVVNGKSVAIDGNPDVVPYVQAPGRTMLPVRFIAEQFGALVTWNSALRRVTLALKVTSPLPSQRIVSFTTSDTSSTLLRLLADESVDVIEMAAGTYHLSYMLININRTRPVVVRPAAGATVVLSGSAIGTDPQFEFGEGGTAGNITMQGLIFDGFILGQSGIVQAKDAHDIALNDMVVRNSRANGTSAQPCHAWAVYVSSNATTHVTDFTANRWTVDGSGCQMGALQVCGGLRVTATGWSVSNAYFAVYANRTQSPLTDFILDDWTISGSGAPMWASSKVSVYVENASGRFSNMHATSSGILLNAGTPKLTNMGGNSMSVMPLERDSTQKFPQI